MRLYELKPRFQILLTPIFHLCLKAEVTPFQLNLLGLVSSLIAGLMLYQASKMNHLYVFIPFLLFIRISSNALDGMVARTIPGIDTKKGNIINELFDRISDIAIFIGLTFAAAESIRVGFVCTLLVVLNSYIGILGQAVYNKRIYAGLMSKADRMLYVGIFSILMFLNIRILTVTMLLYFLLIVTTITIAQRLIYLSKLQ